VLKPRTTTKTRWTREFKLRALARMDEAADITALAKELGVQRGSCSISGAASSDQVARTPCMRLGGR
jgi:transposase-like protein